MLTIHSMPELRSPTFLCGFSGWPDAGSAASGAIEYLIMKWAPRRFAEIDAGAIYVQTAQRPTSRLDRSGERRLRWPNLAFYALPVPHAPGDLVLVLGAEPELCWRTCADAAVGLAERMGATLVATLGAFLAPVPHGGPVRLSGRSSRPDLGRKLAGMGIRDGTYQGPTGFPTVLLEHATGRGLEAASLWAASPIYLRGLPNPKLAAALLGAVERLIQVDVGVAELEVAGRDLERRIDEELRQRPDLERFIERLAGLDEDEEEEPPGDLPSAEEILADLERHLRRLRRGDSPE